MKLEWVSTYFFQSHILSSILLAIVVLSIRYLLVHSIQKSNRVAFETKRRWIVALRNISLILLLVCLGIIWSAEIRSVALSIAVVATAIVIAMKDILSCFLGALLKMSSKSFSVGDRIEVDQIRGDVIDHSLLTTTIMEIGPGSKGHQFTGRVVVLPNSIFATTPVINESYTDHYVLHTFTIPLPSIENWKEVERLVLGAANEECASFIDDARKHMTRVVERQGLEALSPEPRVNLELPDADKANLLVRIPAPTRKRGRIEQAIIRKVLDSPLFKENDSV